MVIKICFDGACKNVPDTATPMGIGVAVYINEEYSEKWSAAEYAGKGTSNIAEWKACVLAFDILWKMKMAGISLEEVYMFSDSQIIARQYNGEYKVKEQAFMPMYRKAKGLGEHLLTAEFRIHWVRREFNVQADILSKKGLKKQHK